MNLFSDFKESFYTAFFRILMKKGLLNILSIWAGLLKSVALLSNSSLNFLSSKINSHLASREYFKESNVNFNYAIF
jgi:hypothetical protein